MKKDGSKIICKADVTYSDPTVTITINCLEPPKDPKQEKKKPSVTIDVKGTTLKKWDGTSTYEITEEDQKTLLDFLKCAKFPELAVATDRPGLFSGDALDRVALTLADIANSIRRRGDDWVEEETGLSFVGFDPGVSAQFALEGPEEAPSLVLSVRLSAEALQGPVQRFRDAFIHPSRPERVGASGELLKD